MKTNFHFSKKKQESIFLHKKDISLPAQF